MRPHRRTSGPAARGLRGWQARCLWTAVSPILGGLAFWTGCGPSSPAPEAAADVVAQVGSEAIRAEALERRLAGRGPAAVSGAQKAEALQELIREAVLHQRAREAGYEQRPEVQAVLRNLVVEKYVQALNASNPPAPVTEAQVLAYYQAHGEAYRVPEQVNAALILLPVPAKATPEKRREAQERAEAVRRQALEQARTTPSFGDLALSSSAHQATRYRGGDLGWLTRKSAEGQFDAPVVEALFALKEPGEVSPAVPGHGGLCLLKLIGRKPAAVKPLAEVRDTVALLLTREAVRARDEAVLARLKQGVAIRVNEDVLARLPRSAGAPPPAPPRMPSR